ncbi:MAG: hypothetical protein QXG86_04000, partial [Candidatus Woesearchaeota archaeon]
MNIENLAETLNAHERKVLPAVDKLTEKGGQFEDVVKISGLSPVETLRALQWLENKGLVKSDSKIIQKIYLGKNGEKYVKKGLPEKRFLSVLSQTPKKIEEIKKEADLDDEEFTASLGILKNKLAISISKEGIKILDNGRRILEKEIIEEKFLEKISHKPLNIEELKPEERFVLEEFRKRKNIVEIKIERDRKVKITEIGKKVVKLQKENLEDRLTKEMLITNKWR